MEDRTQETIEIRHEWVTPELKKIDVEEVTSHQFPFGDEEGEES